MKKKIIKWIADGKPHKITVNGKVVFYGIAGLSN